MVDAAQAADDPDPLSRRAAPKKCFFQKHDTGTFGPHVKHVPIKEKDGRYRGLSLLRRHPGPARLRPDGDDRIPRLGQQGRQGRISRPAGVRPRPRRRARLRQGEGRGGAAARRCSTTSASKSFPLLTGGKGIHVVVPLDASADWPTVKSFAERFSRAIAEAEPETFTANIRKVQRKGRIFLDWLRNQRGATAVMPYSARAREGAPVAAPIAWEELDKYAERPSFQHPRCGRAARARGLEGACGLGQGEASLAGCIRPPPPLSSRFSSSSPPPRRPSWRDGRPRRRA